MARIWGAGLTLRADEDFAAFGDFHQNVGSDMKKIFGRKPFIWTAGLTYGHTDLEEPGSSRLSAQYVSAEAGTYFEGTTLDTSDILDKTITPWALLNPDIMTGKINFWLTKGDIVLTKNVNLHGEYAFHIDAEDAESKPNNLASVSLQYTF
nr:hypothetical protein [uncultured Allisonella sp.]